MNSYNYVIIEHDLDLPQQKSYDIRRQIYNYIKHVSGSDSEVYFRNNTKLKNVCFATYDNRFDEAETTERIRSMNAFFEEHPLIIEGHALRVCITPDLYEELLDIGDEHK